MDGKKTYFYASQSVFDAFTYGQNPSGSLKEVTEAVGNAVGAGELTVSAENPVIIFEKTNSVTPKQVTPRPAAGLAVTSHRKLGKRKPKAESEAPAENAE